MEQYFICDGQVECIPVRQDSQGNYYNQMDDIQDIFPKAARFQVDGKNILFLINKSNNQRQVMNHRSIGHIKMSHEK